MSNRPRWKTLANVELPDGTTIYRAKIIESTCRPDQMSYDALANAFAQEGASSFSWSLHPDGHRRLEGADAFLAGLVAKTDAASLQPDEVHLVIDVSERSARPFMPL